jgi:toxin-antitoxin system PIN domain toxin
MTSFFPDLNVWFALSVEGHKHGGVAWRWLNHLPQGRKLIFSRHTHLGLLRLLTNSAAMGTRTLTVADAMVVYDAWIADPRVEFYQEPRDLNEAFKTAIEPLKKLPATNAVADCYLLAFAKESGLTLVTFDAPLKNGSRKRGYSVVLLE